MNITPTNDLCIIRRIVDEVPTSASGIILAPSTNDEAADTPLKGLVLATGPGRPVKLSGAAVAVESALQELLDAFHAMPNAEGGPRGISLAHWQNAADAITAAQGSVQRVPMQVRAGDTVVFSRNGFQTFRIDGEDLLVCQEASILGVLA